MSSIGFGLLKSVFINEHPFSFLEENGIYREHFIDKELVAYDLIEEHTKRFDVNPQIEVIEAHLRISSNDHYPSPSPFDGLPNEVAGYWINEIKKRKHYRITHEKMLQMRSVVENANSGEVNELLLPIIESLKNELESETEVPETDQPEDHLEFPASVISGLAGNFSHLYSNHLESPIEFFYMSFLTALGCLLADRVYLESEIKQQPRLFCVLLGESADQRKSTAIKKVEDFFREVYPFDNIDEVWNRNGYYGCWGAGSGEGLQKVLERAKKVLLLLDEFKQFVGKCSIKNSSLLPTCNTLFENNHYENAVSKHPIVVHDGHLSILAASTVDTWETIWTPAFTSIGFNNRLFLVPGRSTQRHPLPSVIPLADREALKSRLEDMVHTVGRRKSFEMTTQGEELYRNWYLNRSSSVHAKRLDTYFLRIAPLISLNDGKDDVDADTVLKVIQLVDWQLEVRRRYDPIDSDNKMAEMEQKIRRALTVSRTTSELKRFTNANRSGLWFFEKALENLKRSKDIKNIGTSKRPKWELTTYNN